MSDDYCDDEDSVEVGGWVECWDCGGEGYSYHDCGEDCCCCLHPENNMRCDICDGKGGWIKRPELNADNGSDSRVET